MAYFQQNVWYRFININYKPNYTLSIGYKGNADGSLAMTVIETYSSSENWQIYFQEGRYFLRNWDYRNEWQLGVNGSRSTPQLMPRAEDIYQQWLFEKQDGDTFIIKNEGRGDHLVFGLALNNPTPQMTTNSALAAWLIDPNLSADSEPVSDEMIQSIVVVKPTTNSAIASSTTASTPTGAVAPSDTSSLPNGNDNTSSGSSSGGSLSTGAISGIAIGALALLSLVGLLLFFCQRHSRQPRQPVPPQPFLPQLSSNNRPGATESAKRPVELPVQPL